MATAGDGAARRARILLVEDDDDIRMDLTELLEGEGYLVVAASHGAEALTRIQSEPLPDLILLDLMMPVMDGWTFRSELMATPTLAKIPVILLSGASGVEEEAATLRAASFLVKPFDWETVRATVEKFSGRAVPAADATGS